MITQEEDTLNNSLCGYVLAFSLTLLWLNTTLKLFWSHWAKLKRDRRHVLESPKLDIYEPGPLVLVWRCYLGYHLPRSRTIQESQNNAFSPVNLASKSAHFIWIGNTLRLALWCSPPAGCGKSCGVSSRYLQKLGSELKTFNRSYLNVARLIMIQGKGKCCKVTSFNISHLEAHAGFFRLLLKGIFFDSLDKKLIFYLVKRISTLKSTVF